MRVLLVSHRYPPDGIAGVERITQSLAAELTARGDEVSIVARRPSAEPVAPQTVRERLPDGTLLYRLSGGQVLLDRFLLHASETERLFEAVMVETAPEVVHFMHLMGLSPRIIQIARRHGAGIIASLQDFYFSCPLFLLRKPSGELCSGPAGGTECANTCFADERPDTPLRWGLRTIYFRRLLLMADRLICPSEFVARHFAQFGADIARTRVIANGVSIRNLAHQRPRPSQPRERNELTLAFLGSVLPHKGPHVLLEALRLAGLRSVNVRIFGQTPDQAYVRQLLDRAALVPGLQLDMHGAYEPPQLPSLLCDVDCVIAPSQWPETFAIVAREAFAQGIPVVVSRLGGLPEAITEGRNGLSFEADRPEQLAIIVRRLAQDGSLLPTLREGARTTPVMDAEEHATAVRQVYEEAVESHLTEWEDSRGAVDELNFLHETLLATGFGGIA